MKKKFLIHTAASFIFLIFTLGDLNAQCYYVPATSTAIDSLSYTFSGGSFASFGCAPIDPTYWLSGNGDFITVNFVTAQSYPAFRVWGMNTDDSASVTVNGLSYPLTSSSASYNAKVVCGISPGPDGVAFANGNLVGANTPVMGNYSYQDVQLITTNVTTFTVTGLSGAGWGFAGVSVDCPLQASGTEELSFNNSLFVYPNPGNGDIKITSSSSIEELKVTDVSRRIIYTGNPNEKNSSLQIDNVGIYFLSVTFNKETIIRKVVVCE
jgi:hypothetical protein